MVFYNELSNFFIQGRSPGTCFLVPSDRAIIAIDKLIKINEWLYNDFFQDCSNNPLINAVPETHSQATEQENFTTRNIGRTFAYVNNLCSIERILQRLYEEMIIHLIKLKPTIRRDNDEELRREAEVSDITKFRNKVSAHTSYSQPSHRGIEDTLSTQLTSLAALFECNLGASTLEFSLGDSQTVVGQQTVDIPSISLKLLHPRTGPHYNSWKEMFIKKLTEARSHLPLLIDGKSYTSFL